MVSGKAVQAVGQQQAAGPELVVAPAMARAARTQHDLAVSGRCLSPGDQETGQEEQEGMRGAVHGPSLEAAPIPMSTVTT